MGEGGFSETGRTVDEEDFAEVSGGVVVYGGGGGGVVFWGFGGGGGEDGGVPAFEPAEDLAVGAFVADEVGEAFCAVFFGPEVGFWLFVGVGGSGGGGGGGGGGGLGEGDAFLGVVVGEEGGDGDAEVGGGGGSGSSGHVVCVACAVDSGGLLTDLEGFAGGEDDGEVC